MNKIKLNKKINKILCIIVGVMISSNVVYAQMSDVDNIVPVDANGIVDKEIQNIEPKDDEMPPKDKNGKILTGENLKIYNIIKNVPIYSATKFAPTTTTKDKNTTNVLIKSVQTLFEDKDIYNMNRLYFKNKTDKRYNVSIPILGNKITVRYVHPSTGKWVNTSNMNNLQHATLYIDTDTKSYIVSVPGVYKNQFQNNTLTIAKDKEEMVKIIKKDGYFELNMSFPENSDYIGEYWYMQSDNPLVDWSKRKTFKDLLPHDLSKNRRWCYDGYYFQTPHNYRPGGDGVLYRHPSNYTGSSFVRLNNSDLTKNLGYIMTKVCMQNINEYGYWETGAQSDWLFTDFKIGAGFYDTRFNTDFATSLLYAYQNYNNKEFLAYAVKYANFFLRYANDNSYKTKSGGILVEDYGYEKPHEKTHVSLNHHIAEMNFLYELYSITKEPSYLMLADKMLLGVEDTRNKWILPNGNLVYELYYTKNTNKMEDYPILTYNDLHHTKILLKKIFQKTNDTVEFLMASKKLYMDTNNITGYAK